MIHEFINGTACQFIDDLVTEIEEALSENNPAVVAFNEFNVNTYPSIVERMEQFRVLNGEIKVDNHDNHETQSPPLISKQEQLIEAEMFFSEFDDMKKQAIDNFKTKAKRLLTTQKLKQANMEEFLAITNQPQATYVLRCDGCLLRYRNTMKLFKFALLILPTTSDVEGSFSTMNLLVSLLRTY